MWLQSQKKRPSVLQNSSKKILDFVSFGDELGTGYSGVVRLCVDKKLGKKMACKSIKKENFDDDADVEDVKLEIKVMERLNGHRNLVKLTEVFEDENHVHLVMELCEGGDLFDEIVKRGPVSEAGAANVIRQMAQALAYCHAKGVMHRDVKPENILLVNKSNRQDKTLSSRRGVVATAGDETLDVKLADFGLALFLGPFQDASGFAGSPYYVAPEVISQTWYGKAADIWSLGVVLYVILSGEFPFAGSTDEKLYAAIKRGRVNFTYKPWPMISLEAKSLIKAMLSLDPMLRPSAEDIVQNPWIVSQCTSNSKQSENPSSLNSILKFLAIPSKPSEADTLPVHAPVDASVVTSRISNGAPLSPDGNPLSPSSSQIPQIVVDPQTCPAPLPPLKKKSNFFLDDLQRTSMESATESYQGKGSFLDMKSPKSVLHSAPSESGSESTLSETGSPTASTQTKVEATVAAPVAASPPPAPVPEEESGSWISTYMCSYCETFTVSVKTIGFRIFVTKKEAVVDEEAGVQPAAV